MSEWILSALPKYHKIRCVRIFLFAALLFRTKFRKRVSYPIDMCIIAQIYKYLNISQESLLFPVTFIFDEEADFLAGHTVQMRNCKSWHKAIGEE